MLQAVAVIPRCRTDRRLQGIEDRGHRSAALHVDTDLPAAEVGGDDHLPELGRLMVHRARELAAGAREHNLKDVSVTFPRDRLVVITGLSGSGKSSLAFDTIYAEASYLPLQASRADKGPEGPVQCDTRPGEHAGPALAPPPGLHIMRFRACGRR
jgi:hypothetical protein